MNIFSNKEKFGFLFFVLLIVQLVLLLLYKTVQYSTTIDINFHFFHALPHKAHIPSSTTTKRPKADVSWLDANPIYAKYKIPTAKDLKRVNIVIIVSTAPRRGDRRQAIRETFWKECVPVNGVIPECIFVTDDLKPDKPLYKEIQEEAKKYGDLRFQTLTGGVQFGERLMYHMIYAMKHYEFDYFLRMDDDYFFCLNNFLKELPVPMHPYLHWGWCHPYATIMRPEESMILFSRDVIEKFLKQDKDKMKCHPLADQMVAIWTMELKMNDIFRHDSRLHHTPIVKQTNLLSQNNICSTYIGVHGSYPTEMRTLYSHRGPEKTQKTIVDHSTVMETAKYGAFNWRAFGQMWVYEPKLCINNPTWETPLLGVKNGAYGGRQENGKKKKR